MNTRPFRYIASLLIAVGGTTMAQAQDAVTREPVSRTFAGTQVINAQSIEVVPRKRSFGFMIQHRFGEFGPDQQALKQFAGLDLPANIRFAFQYAPITGMHLELGRSKNGKVYDLGAKARLLRQTVENEVPVSITVWTNVGLMADALPAVGDRDFFADGTTPFAYHFKHRLSYSTEAIVARRFNERISLQLAAVAVYRNLVPVGGSNLSLALPISGRVKVSTKGSVLFEVAPIVEGRSPKEHREPLAIAYEVATTGHVFQIVLASGQEFIGQRLYTSVASRYNEGHMHLGFNIARTLFVKPRKERP